MICRRMLTSGGRTAQELERAARVHPFPWLQGLPCSIILFLPGLLFIDDVHEQATISVDNVLITARYGRGRVG